MNAPHRRASALPVRVGLDLGTFETRVAMPKTAGSTGGIEVLAIPTVVGYTQLSDGAEPITRIGKPALVRREHTRVKNPLLERTTAACPSVQDFALGLRKQLEKRLGSRLWGVVSLGSDAPAREQALKRAIANKIFERVVTVDPAVLIALGEGSQETLQSSIIVDVGRRSTRAVLMQGRAPVEGEHIESRVGGDDLDGVIRRQLAHRFPELLLTELTLTQLKSHLAFVGPAKRRSKVRVLMGSSRRDVDVTEVIESSCRWFVGQITKVVLAILARCPSDESELFQRRIVLVGGGAEMQGLAARLEADLRADGVEHAEVHKPVNSTLLAAKGAYHWACQLRKADWSMPLFGFGA